MTNQIILYTKRMNSLRLFLSNEEGGEKEVASLNLLLSK